MCEQFTLYNIYILMTNKIENQEDLPKNISPQELQKTIAEDKISALNTKISELKNYLNSQS